ncbi:MAG: glucose 1-dehydrogenase [Alphaproteobacteria bacterium]
MRLAGKVAIVTGGGSGIGEEIARTFAREGARVLVTDINVAGGERVAGSIVTANGAAVFQAGDVTSSEDVQAAVDRALAEWGRLDIVVNNAGYAQKGGPMTEVTEAQFDRIFAVNVKGLYHTTNAAIPVFRRQGGGAFLNVASTAALRPRPNLTWYNASKGAVVTLTKSMAVELAGDNIRANAIAPVATDTPLLPTFLGEDTPERRAAFRATVPLGRLGQPSDMANAALYLCSDEAAFVTGVCLEVDGGRCI